MNYKLYTNNENKTRAICLGYFDGIHLGHQELIKKTKNRLFPDGFLIKFVFSTHIIGAFANFIFAIDNVSTKIREIRLTR